MKNRFLLLTCLISFATHAVASTSLVEVYRQAMISDQLYQRAIAQRLSTKEGVPISLSSLLTSANILATPIISRTQASGPGAFLIGNTTQRGYDINLSANQVLFDFGKLANLSGACSLSKQADAILNSATQDLMLRVANAYFTVLNDEDNVRYIIATKTAYAKQLDQVTQQFNVGLKTITDVYTAQASYDSSVASYIAAKTNLANDKENLRVITGIYYRNLSRLSDDFPLISPQPTDIDVWVRIAQRQNWDIKAAQYAASAACANVKQQFAGNLPTLQLQGNYDINFTRTSSNSFGVAPGQTATPEPADQSFVTTSGAAKTKTLSGNLLLNIPLVQGGFVVASTKKAQYDYQVAYANLDQTVRTILNNTRQSYLGVIAGISKIHADKLTIKSTISSLEGLRASYQVGIGTLVDVINQQQRVVQAQLQYASNRYAYINSFLALKASAGILSFSDLQAIDRWLITDNEKEFSDFSDLKKSS